MLTRILICGDPLMTSEKEQRSNTRWLSDFTRRPILNATGVSPTVFVSSERSARGFSRREFFARSGIHCAVEEQQFYFSETEISDESLRYLASFFARGDLVIGYELSDQTREIFHRCSVDYIDIWLHPVRFLDDILFAVDASSPGVREQLHSFGTDHELFWLYADRLRVQNYRGFRRFNTPLVPDSALFVGQTLYDKAVCDRGRMLTLLDYKEDFVRLGARFGTVYYSRHPFVAEGDEDVLAFVRSCRFAKMIEAPTYHLLASDEIRCVTSISSSVVYEASFFGKEVEYLFRPPVRLASESGSEGYATISHELVNPRFWSTILAPLHRTRVCSDVRYTDPKDKLRDALSFYWGYRHIDKVESLRATVGANRQAARVRTATTLPQLAGTNGGEPPLDNAVPEVSAIEKAERLFIDDAVELISFDVFDTLLERPLRSPRDVFSLIEAGCRNRDSEPEQLAFYTHRVNAERVATRRALESGRGEITLTEIYAELQAQTGLSKKRIDALMDDEMATELALARPRRLGRELFNAAIRTNKPIVLTSDMYLPRELIIRMLSKCGYSGFDELYLSSEHGMKKSDGRLFRFILEHRSIDARKIVHVGDNPTGDVDSPSRLGIQVIHVPRAIENLLRYNRPWAQVDRDIARHKNVGTSALIGLYAGRFYDDSSRQFDSQSHFNGDPFVLGYAGLGPAIVSFARWLYDTTVEDGTSQLLFLSRDGRILKTVFDALFSSLPNAPRTHYVFASRRSAGVFSIFDRADILERLTRPLHSRTLGDYLWMNFGLEPSDISDEVLRVHGISGLDLMIGPAFDKDVLHALVLDLEDVILRCAGRERQDYLEYLEQVAMVDTRTAVVDIGYAGTVQRALSRVLRQPIGGYYYITFNTSQIDPRRTVFRGYIGNSLPPDAASYTICTHRFIYETLFCSDESSFLRIARDSNGHVRPVFNEIPHDEARQRVVSAVHDGVTALADDLAHAFGDRVQYLSFDPYSSTRLLDSFLRQPSSLDGRMLSGVVFEDSLIRPTPRYIVPPLDGEPGSKEASAIWREGTAAALRPGERPQPLNAPSALRLDAREGPTLMELMLRAEESLVKRVASGRKRMKYERERHAFFMDSQIAWMRRYGEWTGKLLSRHQSR